MADMQMCCKYDPGRSGPIKRVVPSTRCPNKRVFPLTGCPNKLCYCIGLSVLVSGMNKRTSPGRSCWRSPTCRQDWWFNQRPEFFVSLRHVSLGSDAVVASWLFLVTSWQGLGERLHDVRPNKKLYASAHGPWPPGNRFMAPSLGTQAIGNANAKCQCQCWPVPTIVNLCLLSLLSTFSH